ncbi:hypothetical protein GCM10023116_47920 [Kistimonas scapharcae]|uniref:AAA+ ATPase domain-containing protein n=1 Tax=Kistimonas scapharcae TaxID=1036133 RepID=A0ABP8VAC5_9GAMM
MQSLMLSGINGATNRESSTMATRKSARELPSPKELYDNRNNRAELRKWWHLAFKKAYRSYNWQHIFETSNWIYRTDHPIRINKPLPTCFRDKVHNKVLVFMIVKAITVNRIERLDVFQKFIDAISDKDLAFNDNTDSFGRHKEWTIDVIDAAFKAIRGSHPAPTPTFKDDDMNAPAVPEPAASTDTAQSQLIAKADAFELPNPLTVNGDDGVMSAIDNLLRATGSPYSMNQFVDAINMGMKFRHLAEQQDDEIARLKRMSDDTPKITGKIDAYDSDTDLSIPAGEITYRKACDVFNVPTTDEKTRNALDFDVPYFEWDGEHPWVPEADEFYAFNVDTLLPYLSTIVAGKNAWLYGHTGTGKTTLAQQVCAKLNWPMRRVNFDGDISRLDLVGQTKLDNDDGTTVSRYVDGVLPQAMNSPTILLLDELDVGRPDVLYALQNALDQGQLTITDDGGRRIKAHPFFRAVAACNTQGQGDDSGLYQGTRVLSRALLNRFHNFIPVDYMRRDDELAVLRSKVPTLDDDMADKLMQYVHEHRVAFTSVEVTEPVSLRNIIGAAQEYSFYHTRIGTADAINLAISNTILNRANPEDRIVLRGIAQRVFPGAGF